MTDQIDTDVKALEVIDRSTGEVIDVRAAATEDLARFMVNFAAFQADLADGAAIVEEEIRRRLDRGGKWTIREGDPAAGVQYEITAPSPTAGTEGYDPAILEQVLQDLVEDDVISPDAAEAALRRTVAVTFHIPWADEPEDLVRQAEKDDRVKNTPTILCAPVKAGIAALEKLGDHVTDRLARAKVRTTPPKRKVKVSEIRPERAS